MLAAATAGGVRRFVHVSSLAAREPKLSLYGASKARAEELVRSSGLDWVIVRPPAVYGPGDKETLELFRMAKLGLMLMPPKGRVSLIHADDLARLLLALADADAPSSIVIEADDGAPDGWTHREFAPRARQSGRHQAGDRLLARNRCSASPPAPTNCCAATKAKLTADRAAYFSHRNWVIDPKRACPPGLWQPQVADRCKASPKPPNGTASRAGSNPPHSRPIALLMTGLGTNGKPMPDRQETYAKSPRADRALQQEGRRRSPKPRASPRTSNGTASPCSISSPTSRMSSTSSSR